MFLKNADLRLKHQGIQSLQYIGIKLTNHHGGGGGATPWFWTPTNPPN